MTIESAPFTRNLIFPLCRTMMDARLRLLLNSKKLSTSISWSTPLIWTTLPTVVFFLKT